MLNVIEKRGPELADNNVRKQPLVAEVMNDQVKKTEDTLAALRRAEQKYRSIFEHCLEGIFQTTPEGKYISANPALARMYGYQTADELIADLTDITHQLYVQPGRRSEFIQLVRENG